MFANLLGFWLLVMLCNLQSRTATNLKLCTDRKNTSHTYIVFSKDDCKIKYRLIYDKDTHIEKIVLNSGLHLKNHRILNKYDELMQMTLGLVVKDNSSLALLKLKNTWRLNEPQCDFEEEQIKV
jgi:hypothetical protein